MATNKFMALGFSARDVLPTLTAVGDAAAAMGGGADMIDGITMALGQMKIKGPVQAEELLQLAERGIPVYQILQEQLGLTGDQIANIGKYAIPADKAIQAIVTGLEKRFSGMMNKMSDTTSGMISTIKDDLKMLAAGVTSGAFSVLKNRIRGIRDELDRLLSAFRKGGVKGFFQALVPPDMQGPLLVILGSLKSLWLSFLRLLQAAKPVGKILFADLAIVLPVVAQLFDWFSRLALVVSQNKQLVGLLAGALMSLLIAGAVAKAISLLTWAIRMLAIAETAAAAIKNLRTALIALQAAMARNVVGLVIMIIGALIGLVLTSEWAGNILGKAFDKIGNNLGAQLPGVDTKPMEDYINTLNDAANATQNVGDSADKSGSQLKKFLAAFDEIYQVDDNQDTSGGPGGGINLPLPPSFSGGSGGSGGSDGSDNGGNSGFPGIPAKKGSDSSGGPPNIGIWAALAAAVAAAAAAVATGVDKIKQKLGELKGDLGKLGESIPGGLSSGLALGLALFAAFTGNWNGAWQIFKTGLQLGWQELTTQLQTTWQGLWSGNEQTWGAFTVGALAVAAAFILALTGGFGALAAGLIAIVVGLAGGMSGVFSGLWQWLVDMWNNHKGIVIGILAGLAVAIVTILTGGLDGLVAAVVAFLPQIAGF